MPRNPARDSRPAGAREGLGTRLLGTICVTTVTLRSYGILFVPNICVGPKYLRYFWAQGDIILGDDFLGVIILGDDSGRNNFGRRFSGRNHSGRRFLGVTILFLGAGCKNVWA